MPESDSMKYPGVGRPWEPSHDSLLASVREQIPFDALCLALFQGRTPQLDELLVFSGLPEDAAGRWCAAGLDQVGLFRTAARHGMALGLAGQDNGDAALAGLNVMVHMLPESLAEPRWWWLLLASRSRSFS